MLNAYLKEISKYRNKYKNFWVQLCTTKCITNIPKHQTFYTDPFLLKNGRVNDPPQGDQRRNLAIENWNSSIRNKKCIM